MDQGEDQLMHFFWKDRKNNTVEDDFILFPDEAEFIRVDQCTTGRVYILNFKSSSRKLFYWMQDAKDEKDEENVAKLNRLINDPQGGLAESRQQNNAGQLGSPFRNMDDLGFGVDQEQLLQLLQGGIGGLPITSTTPASEPQSATAATSEAGSGAQTTEQNIGFTPEQLEQLGGLRNVLPNIQNPEGGTRHALFPHLPSNIERTPEELNAVLNSPQFAQALQSLSMALQSGQLGPLLTQLGLDPSAGNGVEAFLRAVQEQAGRRQRDHNDDDNTDDHSGDRMEED
ncbi:17443_t:CDS:2 [Funneliformis geosporum]|uniref:4031_t:CDS:1 n=1 Tax=Funneliformis geosporum TaxID=1117311 RepID=A0A9W4WL22_9GLOM|nr:17443_t:CDS:2 [Funneliformis geosporum]CAI2169978.1 4031_t:CDS:2 [Funneliformis geosporum]